MNDFVDVKNDLYEEDNYSHPEPGLIYITTSCSGPGIDEDVYGTLIEGCNCNSNCLPETCSCLKSYTKSTLKKTRFDDANAMFECNDRCKCDPKVCENRLVQKGPLKGLKISLIEEKGFGVFTSVNIPKDHFVCEYAGEIIGEKEAKKRLEMQEESRKSNYILVMKEHGALLNKVETTIVDPTNLGNIGRYFNHSCDPNIKVVPVRIHSLVPVAALVSTRPIEKGKELCYDYESSSSFDNQNPPVSSPQETSATKSDEDFLLKKCLCLSKYCRGFLPHNKFIFY